MNSKDQFLNDSIVTEEVAIIGMACRFPGGSNNPSEFWAFLKNRGDGIVSVPPDRWDNKAYYDPDREKKNRMYVNRGGFLKTIDQFDPLFFGISPAEAAKIDPQHRWLLELTYEALENAGLKARDLKGSDTAVYIGQFMHDYEQLQLDALAHEGLNAHSATGPSMTLTANRISYIFDFKGPSVTLDTACSSSLVAIDLACKALLAGDSGLAVAGGVNILLRPELTMSICRASMLSPDGRCKSFDASANGYVRSEGAGVVLLKRLSAARRDGDPILAVIKSSAVNQDGQTLGITVPSGEAQQLLLAKTLARASLSGADIDYVEAHGTGTAVGDPIEVNALGKVVGVRPQEAEPCIIGSVKSNIGHTEAAAGVAGVIKTVLALNEGLIPPNLHLETVNPAIELDDLKVRLAERAFPWPRPTATVRRAVVNSFGFGGTNANLVLEKEIRLEAAGPRTEDPGRAFKLLLLSSKTEAGLRDQVAKYRAFFQRRSENQKAGVTSTETMGDISFTAATKREHHRYRLALSGTTESEWIQSLDAYSRGEAAIHYTVGSASSQSAGGLCFVYSGMGTQWARMGRELYRTEPVFQEIFDRCSEALERQAGWSLKTAVFLEDERLISDTYVAQPALFAIQAALTGLLETWGIVPSAVVGHSAGEVCAAYIAGALDFEDAIRVIYHRSRLQQTTEGEGKMLAVGLTQAALGPYLKGLETKVSIAAINSEDAVTLAGEEASLTQIAARLEDEGRFARFLKVGVPYHSPVMDRLRQPLIDALQGLIVRVPRLPLYSTVSGKLTQPGDWGPEYWADNVRQPVLFQAAIDALIAAGFGAFLEVAPNAALASSIEKTLAQGKAKGWVVPTLKREQDDRLMISVALGNLHVKGWPIDWKRIYPQGRIASLPNYAWQHASYWSEDPEVQRARLKNLGGGGGFSEAVHPLLGGKLQSPTGLWQKRLDLQEQKYLADHQVENEVVYPAAGYIEMALAVAYASGRSEPIELEETEFKRALFLSTDQPTRLETTAAENPVSVLIHAIDPQTGQWNAYSQTLLCDAPAQPRRAVIDLDELKSRLDSRLEPAEFYARCHRLGLTYQGAFRAVQAVWHNREASLVELSVAEDLATPEYHLHPALLDGGFQAVFALLENGYLPVRIGTIRYLKRPDLHCYCLVQFTGRGAEEIKGDLWLFNPDGSVAVEMVGVELKSTKTQASAATNLDALLYDYDWRFTSYPEIRDGVPAGSDGLWLIVSDEGGLADVLAGELKARHRSVAVIGVGNAEVEVGGAEKRSKPIQSADEWLPLLTPCAASCEGVIYLRAISPGTKEDEREAVDPLEASRATTVEPLHFAQALDRVEWRRTLQVCFVSTSAHQVSVDDPAPRPAQGALWGFGRVFTSEYTSFKTRLIDLPETITSELIGHLADELLNGSEEQEVALRVAGRSVHRLRPLTETLLHQEAELPRVDARQTPFKINLRHRPVGDDRFVLTACRLAEPAEQAVEVAVAATALTFDPGAQGGASVDSGTSAPRGSIQAVAGVVSWVGAKVKTYSGGEYVVGFTRDGLKSGTQVEANLLAKVPAHLKAEEAVALPAAFLPAHFALHELGRLRDGEAVLIHQADESIGQAAVQLAKLKGAIIFATVSSPQTADLLRLWGVAAVYPSGNDSFLEQVHAATGGRGVDLIVNARPGRFLAKNLTVLRPYGRLVDLSQGSSSAMPLNWPKGVSYHRFDLSELVTQFPDRCREVLEEIVSLFCSATLQPLALQTFSVSNLDPAISFLASRSAFSVAALSFAELPSRVAAGVRDQSVAPNRTYLVTGGVGGLGLEVMRWLIGQGARSIVLLGRSAPSAEAQRAIDAAAGPGVAITLLSVDIAEINQVERVLRHIADYLPPLGGILHAAGVLDDGVIAQQTAERFERVLRPKVKGAWNLHLLTRHMSLDFFVLFSSVASVVGWSGQSNYAAANAFMDTLAQRRRALGLPALSINWGPWSGAGMAAQLAAREQQRMEESGMRGLASDQALAAMAQLLRFPTAQAGVFEIDWARLFRSEPNATGRTVFRDLVQEEKAGETMDIVERLKQAAPEDQTALVAQEVNSVVAAVLGLKEPDAIDRDKSVIDYGVNSLMAMDLRNRLRRVLKTKLPATFALKYPTVNTMTDYIVEQQRSTLSAQNDDLLYWDPKTPQVVHNYEINGRLATLTPTILHWIHEGHNHFFNVGALLEIDDEPFDVNAFKTALKIMLAHHDGARSQFFYEEGELRQEIVPLGDHLEVVEHDFTGLGYEAGAARMKEINDRLHRSFRFERGEFLYRAAYYKLDDRVPHRVFLIFHHYVSDALSQKTIGHGLMDAYFKVKNQQPVYLPRKNYTLIDWTRRLQTFAHREAVDELPGWLAKIQRSRACFIPDDFVSTRERQLDDYTTFTSFIGSEDYARVAEFCRIRNLEIADLCTYALIKAFSRLTGAESLWVDVIIHARSGIFPDVAIPDLFGQISESASILFELTPNASLEDQISTIGRQRSDVSHGGIGLRALRFLNRTPEIRSQLDRDESPQIGLNLDLTDYAAQADQSRFRFGREGVGEKQDPHLRKKADELRLAFFICPRVIKGVFSLEVGYYKDRFYKRTIEQLTEDFFAAFTGAAGPVAPRMPMPRAEAMEGRETDDFRFADGDSSTALASEGKG